MQKYPNYQQYLEFLALRDQGMLFVALVVLVCVVILIEARYLWPKLQPVARYGLLVVFYASLAIMVIRQVISG
jgi:uncharacterized membrane protein YhhN